MIREDTSWRFGAVAQDRRRRLTVVAAALACATVITACGGSSNGGGTTGSGPPPKRFEAAALKFSQCMRSHGVTNFPDPSSGGGINIQAGSGIDPFSPAFKAAQGACKSLLPGGGPGARHPSAQAMAAMVKTSECMRAHGVTGFPDPTTKPPSNPQSYGEIEDRNGVVIAIPTTINPQSPTFEHAATACGFS